MPTCSHFNQVKETEAGGIGAWRTIALCGFYSLLGALAAAVAALVGTLPHWI